MTNASRRERGENRVESKEDKVKQCWEPMRLMLVGDIEDVVEVPAKPVLTPPVKPPPA